MWKRIIVAGVLLLLLGAGLWRLVVLWPRAQAPVVPPEPDPRVVYDGPFRNLEPTIKYVGDARCIECHSDIAQTYMHHPMGNSLRPIAQVREADLLNPKFHMPIEKFKSRFTVEHQDGKVFHRQVRLDEKGQPIWEVLLPVHFAIGSGNHGKSYLSLRDSSVFMTPISWYKQKKIWDLSPGFTPALFHGRDTPPSCLYCHSNHVEPIPGYTNKFRQPVFHPGHAIGCERCHGPGQLHVDDETGRFRGAVTATDHTLPDPNRTEPANFAIVNPHHLTPARRDAVCAQCHLEGVERILRRGRGLNDFRPGLPLESVWATFVLAQEEEEKVAVSHFEEMYLSRCFQKTSGLYKLGCVTCHNPHEKPSPERRVAWFRDACLQCHAASDPSLAAGGAGPPRKLPKFFRKGAPQAKACSEPLAVRLRKNQDSCKACHMPTTQLLDISHNAFTDHRILKSPDHKPRHSAAPPKHGTKLPLVHFQKGPLDPNDRATGRDYGVALALMIAKQEVPGHYAEKALQLLNDAVADYPADWNAWDAKGQLLLLSNTKEHVEQALDSFQTVLKDAPDNETSLFGAAEACYRLKRKQEAIDYYRRAIAIDPWQHIFYARLVELLTERKDWAEATKPCRKWRELDPENIQARQLWIRCLLDARKTAEARAELALIQRMVESPARRQELERWFEDLVDFGNR